MHRTATGACLSAVRLVAAQGLIAGADRWFVGDLVALSAIHWSTPKDRGLADQVRREVPDALEALR